MIEHRVVILQIHSRRRAWRLTDPRPVYEVRVDAEKDYAWTLRGAKRLARKIIKRRHQRRQYPKVISEYTLQGKDINDA
jgi:hypothetical protein